MEQVLNINYEELAQKRDSLLNEIRKTLNTYNAYKAGLVIRRIFQIIRKNLTVYESAEFIRRLPEYLKVLYVMDWNHNEEKINLKHLDEFTEEVLHVDNVSEERAFYKEVDALTAVITVLKALNHHVNLLSFPSFNYNLKRELEESMLDTAA